MTDDKPPRPRRRKSVLVIGGDRPEPGRVVIRDPAERLKVSPPPSAEAMRRMERLERSSAAARARMRDILLD